MANKGLNPYTKVGARGLTTHDYRRWPGGIVYYTIDTRKLSLEIDDARMTAGWEKQCPIILIYFPGAVTPKVSLFDSSNSKGCFSLIQCVT